MSIVDEKFNEWTKGLASKEARIAVFEHIRDIPYAIVPSLRSPDFGPTGLLEQGKGSCQPKHYLMAQLFQKLNIPTRLVTYVFRWAEPEIRYPADLKNLISRMPVGYHLACKANINGEWVLVDATWDPPLKKVGFPVNEKWDGESGTKNAVTPIKEIIHESVEDRVLFEVDRRARYTPAENALYAEFIDKLNAWLDKVREMP